MLFIFNIRFIFIFQWQVQELIKKSWKSVVGSRGIWTQGCTRRRHRQTTEPWRPNNVLWAVNGSFDASSKARKNIIPCWLFSESVVLSRLETSSLQWGTFPGMEAVISIFDHTLSSVKTSLIAAQATFSISLSLSYFLPFSRSQTLSMFVFDTISTWPSLALTLSLSLPLCLPLNK